MSRRPSAKGDSCCKSEAKVVEAANVEKAGCCPTRRPPRLSRRAPSPSRRAARTRPRRPRSCRPRTLRRPNALGRFVLRRCREDRFRGCRCPEGDLRHQTTAATMPVAAAASSCCSAKSVSNVATLPCGSKNMPVRIVAAEPGRDARDVLPGPQHVELRHDRRRRCRSAENASGLSTCSGVAADGSEKSCCDEGVATIPASNVEASECSQGDSCCSADAKVVEAANVAKADCGESAATAPTRPNAAASAKPRSSKPPTSRRRNPAARRRPTRKSLRPRTLRRPSARAIPAARPTRRSSRPAMWRRANVRQMRRQVRKFSKEVASN